MIEYESKNKEKIRNILSNYIYLKTKNDDVIGMYIKYFYDECNHFEIVSIHNNLIDNTNNMLFFDNDLVKFTNINKDEIKNMDYVVYCDPIYDPNLVIYNEKNRLINEDKIDYDEKYNELYVGKSFRSDIKYISKIEEPFDINMRDEQRFNSLVQLYANIIMYNDQLDVYKYFILYSLIINNKIDLLDTDYKFQFDALNEARQKVENKILPKNKQKILK